MRHVNALGVLPERCRLETYDNGEKLFYTLLRKMYIMVEQLCYRLKNGQLGEIYM